jgi:hypothetical protein
MRPSIYRILIIMPACAALSPLRAETDGNRVETPYGEQKVAFDFYFTEPATIGSALYWIRSLMNPLMESRYGQASELMEIIVVIHGTEIVIVTVAQHTRTVPRASRTHALLRRPWRRFQGLRPRC